MPTDDLAEPARPGPDADDFSALLARIQAKDQTAARTLYNRYDLKIRDAVRRHYLTPNSPLRCDLESDDLVQMTWLSVFEQLAHGTTFPSEARFAAFVLALLKSQYLHCYRDRMTAAKCTMTREVSLEKAGCELRDRASEPGDRAAAKEEWQRIVDYKPKQKQAIMLALSDGSRVADVAARFGISVRTVERIVQRVHF